MVKEKYLFFRNLCIKKKTEGGGNWGGGWREEKLR